MINQHVSIKQGRRLMPELRFLNPTIMDPYSLEGQPGVGTHTVDYLGAVAQAVCNIADEHRVGLAVVDHVEHLWPKTCGMRHSPCSMRRAPLPHCAHCAVRHVLQLAGHEHYPALQRATRGTGTGSGLISAHLGGAQQRVVQQLLLPRLHERHKLLLRAPLP